MHIHERDEVCGNQQLVGDGIEQNSQGSYLQTAACKVSIGPIRRCGGKQNQHAEKLKADVKPP